MIRCRTLGGCDLEVDGAPPPKDLQWKKNVGLLVYLARSPKRGRTRDQLIGALWADKPEKAARGSLKTALSTLRQRLGDGSLVTSLDQVRLNPGFVELDIDRFEYLARVGDLKGATELVGGDFLAGFNVPDAAEFEQWALGERTGLRPRLVDVLTKRAEELLELGREPEALLIADRALHLDDLHEPAVRAAMRALARNDDRTEALRRYDVFKARLAEDVGAVPGREAEALAQRFRVEDWRPPARTTGEARDADSEPARRAPLEERVHVLERLLAVWRACRDRGRPSLAIIEGDPGMGKTRLTEELVARARVDGAAIAAIRAVEADLTAPWSGVLGLCRGALLAAPGVAGATPDALAVLRDASSGSAPFGRAFSDVVQAVCHEQPLVLVLEDAQWLDRESLLAALATLRDASSAPLCIVVTVPSRVPRAELDEMRARLGRDVTGVVVRLGPLSEEAVVRMARWALPISDAGRIARVGRRVAADSGGIPLLAVALLEAIGAGLELGEPTKATPGDGWPIRGRTLDDTRPGDLPDSVVGAIRVMFGRVSADGQALLVAAAVLGRVPGASLGTGAGLAGGRLAGALDELERKQWLAPDPRGYTFVARIVREVIDRDMVTEGQRLRIREAAGGP